MSEKTAQHNRQVWEKFWDQGKPIAEVYTNSGRLVRQMQQLGPMTGKRILEVGAGSGRDGFELAQQGAQVVFLDYAQNSLATIKRIAEQLHQPVALVRGDAFRLPFKSGCLDVVYHQGLLEHFTKPLGIVAENGRVVKTGGYVLADVPHRYHPYTLVKHVLIALHKWFAGWETEFSRRQLQDLFRAAGLEPIGFYGEWMRPSFAYRLLRELLKKFSCRLPLYPKSIPGLSKPRRRLARCFARTRLAQYTFMDIGVIGTRR